MRISHHMAIGTIGMLPLMNGSVSGAAAFWFGSLLVDLDHFLFYALQTGTVSFSPTRMFQRYRDWDFYGPRIHLFHNYETVLLLIWLGLAFDGVIVYLGAGIIVHLACDQFDTYRLFRYFRIRTLTGDVLRYIRFWKAGRQGTVKSYMVTRRDTWWNHLHQHLNPDRFMSAQAQCAILKIHPEVPIDSFGGSGDWHKML